MSAGNVLEAIRGGKVFLITSHVNLEGDALGAEIAMSYLLRKMDRSCFICNASPIPRIYNFLPSLEIVKTVDDKPRDFDTAIIIDCSDLDRIGRVKKLITKDKPIINIDHHMDNKNFGAVNWVDAGSSAAGEMIYELFRKSSLVLDEDTALCLYVAILTDTGSFRYNSTTARTHMIAGELLKYGIKPDVIFKRIYASCRLSRMKLLALSLSGLKKDEDNGIIWMSVSQKMLKESRTGIEDIEGFIEIISSVENTKVAVLFQEVKENVIKIGFRSDGEINVSKIARYFGGGGHFAASGCLLNGELKTVEKAVLDKIRAELNR